MKRLILLALLALAQPALSETLAAKLFVAKTHPTSGAALPIGTYARGCAAGNVELPETGPTWQAMRLNRNRNWGHPELVDYLQVLALGVAKLNCNRKIFAQISYWYIFW